MTRRQEEKKQDINTEKVETFEKMKERNSMTKTSGKKLLEIV